MVCISAGLFVVAQEERGGQRLHRGAGMSLGLVRCLFTDHIRSPVSQIPAIVKTSALSRFGMAVNTPCTS